MSEAVKVTFSIVSHGHGGFIDRLFADLEKLSLPPYEILLTLNAREDERYISNHPKLPVRVIRNDECRGFGANHNQAFQHAIGDYFAIINPDVRLIDFTLDPLLTLLAGDPDVGLVAPLVYSSDGKLQDSARKFPTFLRLLSRKFSARSSFDYPISKSPVVVDWVAGMFMVFRREVFERIGGFDEKFFMYFEDVDICSRLAERGWRIVVDPSASIIHDAQRASRWNWRHFRWHLGSAFRYLTGL